MVKEYDGEFKIDCIALFETKVSGHKVESVCAKMGFEYSFQIEVVGFRCGIWFLWKEGTSIEILQVHPQFLHVRIRDKRCYRSFLYTAVYTSPHRALKTQLWEHLNELASKVREPWLLAGDLNVIVGSDE